MSSLRKFTTMKIGGEVEHSVSLADLPGSQLTKPIRVLGNGSNVLIDDHPLKGSVILCRDFEMQEPEVLNEDGDSVELECSAGTYLPSLARWAQKNSLTGLEFMVGVPGTLGGAVAQNAGATRQETKDVLLSARLFDLETQNIRDWSVEELQMSYRMSLVKPKKQVVLSCRLKLKKAEAKEIDSRLEENLRYRKEKTPYTKPSLGSVFTRLPDGSGGWLYPGKLIEDAGLKAYQVGKARVSDVHANYIVNEGGASFEDVYRIILRIEDRIRQKFGIEMKREIEIWSDRNLEELRA